MPGRIMNVSRVTSEQRQVKVKGKRKKRKEIPVVVVAVLVPMLCAVIGAIGVIVGAKISKPSPSSPEPESSAASTPPPLGAGAYTISSAALGFLDVPNPDGSGLIEYSCQALSTGTSRSSFRLCFDELDVIDSDMGVGTRNTLNKVWNIDASDAGSGYTIRSAYNGKVSEGIPLSPPACDRFASMSAQLPNPPTRCGQ